MIKIIILITLIIITAMLRYTKNNRWSSTLFNSGHWIEYHQPKKAISKYRLSIIILFLYCIYLLIDLILW